MTTEYRSYSMVVPSLLELLQYGDMSKLIGKDNLLVSYE